MDKKDRALLTINTLRRLYPDISNELCLNFDREKPWQLLFAARLSAQCSDIRVNSVTPILFSTFPTLEDFAAADIEAIEEIVKPCGLYKVKAKNLKDAAVILVGEFNSKLPDNIEDLLKIPGIGRKTANLIIGDIYKKPALIVDTHFIRISKRLGLTDKISAEVIERELLELIPPDESADFCHRIVFFGREYCTARSPNCRECPLEEFYICQLSI